MSTIQRLLFVLAVLLVSVTPALAQEPASARIALGAFSFTPDPALGANVNIVRFPAGAEMTFPPQAEHTEFMLYHALPAPFNFTDAAATIYVYPVAGFTGMPEHEARMAALQTLLIERPDLETYIAAEAGGQGVALPFLPLFAAGQVIRARAQYVETPALAGISYITAYAEAQEPFLADHFLYTFQGISADGQYYVSVLMRLVTDLFPAEPDPAFGVAELQADIATYMNASAATLNAATPGNFTPALDSLDALVASFAFTQ